MITQFSVNESGRDFVVGDLHGMFSLLQSALEHLQFDPKVDRLISVGDLVDRGPNSLECLKLLDESWFYSVKGNHEQLMEDYLTGGRTGAWWFHNGGGWWLDLDILEKDEVNRLMPKVQMLPWIILVPMRNGKRFIVLHAELAKHPTEVITDATLFEFFDIVARRHVGDGEAAIWGRKLWGNLYAQTIDDRVARKTRKTIDLYGHFFNDKLSHIFSGHTTVKQPTTILGQTNLDTGAFRVDMNDWAALTIAEPLTGKFWTTNDTGTREVQPLVI